MLPSGPHALENHLYLSLVIPVHRAHDQAGQMYVSFLSSHLTLPDSTPCAKYLGPRSFPPKMIQTCVQDVAGKLSSFLLPMVHIQLEGTSLGDDGRKPSRGPLITLPLLPEWWRASCLWQSAQTPLPFSAPSHRFLCSFMSLCATILAWCFAGNSLRPPATFHYSPICICDEQCFVST